MMKPGEAVPGCLIHTRYRGRSHQVWRPKSMKVTRVLCDRENVIGSFCIMLYSKSTGCGRVKKANWKDSYRETEIISQLYSVHSWLVRKSRDRFGHPRREQGNLKTQYLTRRHASWSFQRGGWRHVKMVRGRDSASVYSPKWYIITSTSENNNGTHFRK